MELCLSRVSRLFGLSCRSSFSADLLSGHWGAHRVGPIHGLQQRYSMRSLSRAFSADSGNIETKKEMEQEKILPNALERFAFDRTCKWSRKADVLLEFDDKSTLHAHRTLLCLASHVLEDELEKQSAPYKLKMHNVSSAVWKMMLHMLYPIHTKKKDFEGLSQDTFVEMSGQAHKYKIDEIKNELSEIFKDERFLKGEFWKGEKEVAKKGSGEEEKAKAALAAMETRRRIICTFAKCVFEHNYNTQMKHLFAEKLSRLVCEPGSRRVPISKTGNYHLRNVPQIDVLIREDMQASFEAMPKEWVMHSMRILTENAQGTPDCI